MNESKEKFNLPQLEEKILEFWKKNKVFAKTLAKTKRGKKFVFYEGPPTANGLPHIGHALTRAFKDVILRYKTMRGFFVPRKAGWDTHGLPVEIEVEKELGFKTKQDIEKYGIARFNRKAKESVWRYKDQWEKSTKRLGFWLDVEHPYITYETSYIESLWWIIKEIWKKGLLYQGFKVVPWCSRCGTGLSSHELGLGYKKVNEDSIYVKLKFKDRKKEFLLVWTTTPWTLPANVAVALHPKFEYTKFKIGGEFIWSAHTPPYDKDQKITVIEKISAKSLLGLAYEPLFQVPQEFSLGAPPPFKILPGEFVTLKEGTGMVHLAPAFGDEDMGVVKNIYGEKDYPLLHTVNPDGTMKKGIVGEGLFAKDADRLIIEDLKRRGLLYRVEPHEHDYPFCWRCGTPLLYFAKTAWWIKVSSLKEKLISANKKINWVPEHLREGRFGEFLREVRDWAFSRERYWGTPLPVWQCEKCVSVEVVASRDELSRLSVPVRNKYLIMRHGESLSNVRNAAGANYTYPLTLRGKVQAEKAARTLVKQKIDLIFSSGIERTKETAEIVAKILGVKKANFDKRLEEINVGVFTGKHPKEYHAYFSSLLEKFTKRPPGGETLAEVRTRLMHFWEELEKKYSGKNILIVGHEYPLWMLYAGALGLSDEETAALRGGKGKEDFIHFAEVIAMPYRNLPRDNNGEVNLHRPFVDSFELSCPRCKGRMRRVPEVVDVWFDSGSMPYAQHHYPFSHKEDWSFPADYICEAIDQTRGWFYTLLAVSVLLGRGRPYKNVISLGHVLDRNGQKMSKSKSNVVDPESIIKKYGADTLRWYFFTLNAVGEPKRFDEKDLFNKLRGFLLTFWNCFVLFDTYIDNLRITDLDELRIRNGVLAKWILAKLDQLIDEVTSKLDSYDIIGAGRAIEEFTINDFSQWFLRRSRRRLQHPDSEKDKNGVGAVIGYILFNICKIASPFVPFLTEAVYQKLRRKLGLKEISVHLESWSRSLKIRGAKKLLLEMELVRHVCSEALRQRAGKGIKVRQPLAKLQIKNSELRKNKDLLNLIKDEVNVQEVTFGDELKLDTVLTPELKEEGLVREFIRNVQEMRRDAGLKPREIITIQIQGGGDVEKVISKNTAMVKKETNACELRVGGKKIFEVEREVDLNGTQFWVGIVSN